MRALLVHALALAALSSSSSAGSTGIAVDTSATRVSGRIAALSGFVENRGQWPEGVLYMARLGRIEATLLRDALVFRPVPNPEACEITSPPLVLWLPGDGTGSASGVGENVTRHHFLLASGFASDARGFDSVIYRGVRPGVDVVVRADGERFAYDVHVAPGADLASVVFEIEGVQGVESPRGDVLVMHTAAGPIEQRIGASWQVDPHSGEREALSARFRVLESVEGRARLGFEAPGRDADRALVIDPSLVYATYIGGAGQELLERMAVDATGAAYMVCRSSSLTPTTPGSAQPTFGGSYDAWVGKLSPDGKALEWGSYLGGSDVEAVSGVAVDTDGTVVVSGHTWSNDFPTTPGSYQSVFAGVATKSDIFVTRLDPSGGAMVWSTFYGGPDYDTASAMALLPSGDVIVAGDPWSATPPATAGAFDTTFDTYDQMLLRLSADGSALVFHTFFSATRILDIAVDGDANIYLCGDTHPTFTPVPATPGAFKTSMAAGDTSDGYVAKMSSSGADLHWATFLGGGGLETVWAIAIDAARAVYVAGQTGSSDFPTTIGAFQLTGGLGFTGCATKLLPEGSGVVWSTYLGGCCGGSGYLRDVSVDLAGNAHVAGAYNEPSFPTTPDAFQPFFIGGFPSSDATLTKLDAFGEQLVYSTWFGGAETDYRANVGIDGSGHPHLAVMSFSSDIPVTPDAYDATQAGFGDIVVAEFDLPLQPWRVLAGGLKGGVDTPNLAGSGSLTPGSTTRLSVRGAAPHSFAWFVAGLSSLHFPLLGGTLVPAPDVFFALPTSASGSIDFTAPWPSLAPGSRVLFQFWVFDPGAPQGWSATNAVQATAQ